MRTLLLSSAVSYLYVVFTDVLGCPLYTRPYMCIMLGECPSHLQSGGQCSRLCPYFAVRGDYLYCTRHFSWDPGFRMGKYVHIGNRRPEDEKHLGGYAPWGG